MTIQIDYVILEHADFDLLFDFFNCRSDIVFCCFMSNYLLSCKNYTVRQDYYNQMAEYICNSGEGSYHIYSFLCNYF